MKELKYVLSGQLRKKVLLYLIVPTTPTELTKKIKGDRSSVSRVLLYFQEKGLAKCINNEDKRGRIYQLTEKGKKVYDMLKKV
jgi:DNA-binding MarR family transcriptional regulator